MRSLVVCALVLALLPGCKKDLDQQVKPDENAKTLKQVLTEQKGPGAHAPTGVALGQPSGGSGGAAQAVRTAVVRTVNITEMQTIAQFMEADSTPTGQLPGKEQVMKSLERDARKTLELVKENIIILTDTRARDSIWAYTYNPQSAAGEHLVIRSGTVERMMPNDLRQALNNQGIR